MKPIVNKQARFDYQILESFEAGLVLKSDEIKAIRANQANLKGSYVKIFYSKNLAPELFLVGSHFKSQALDPYRTRKLLVRKDEIKRLVGKTTERGLTLVPLKIYVKAGKAKLQVALARGKKKFDKREAIKRRDLDREQRRYSS